MGVVALTLAVALAGPTAGGEVGAAAPSVVVMRIESGNALATGSADLLTAVVTSHIRNLGTFGRVMGAGELESMLSLEKQKQLMECSAESCMAEIAGALGARFMALTRVGKLGESLVVTFSLLDTQAASMRASADEQLLSTDEAQLGAVMNRLVYRALQTAGLLVAGATPPPAQKVAGPPASPPVLGHALHPAPHHRTSAAPPPAVRTPSPEGEPQKQKGEPGSALPRRSTVLGILSLPPLTLGVLALVSLPLHLLVGTMGVGAMGLAVLVAASGDETSADPVGSAGLVMLGLATMLLLAAALAGLVSLGLGGGLGIAAAVTRGGETVADLVADQRSGAPGLTRVRTPRPGGARLRSR